MDLAIGRISKVHGIRGDVVVDVRTDSPEERFALGASVRIAANRDAAEEQRIVKAARWHGSRLLLRFEGIVDRDAAEKLRGRILIADSADIQDDDLDDDEFHDTQLIGLKAQLPDNTRIGSVTDVLHTPGGELLVISIAPSFGAERAAQAARSAANVEKTAQKDSSVSVERKAPTPTSLTRAKKSKEVLIPFVRTIVTDVDLNQGTVIIDAPEGLLDI